MKTKPRILLVDLITPLQDAHGHYPDVFLASVACISTEDGKPRNWRRPYADERIKNDTGGFTIRAFKSDDNRLLFSFTAADVKCCDFNEYLEVANALKAMDKRMAHLRESIGCPHGEIERMIHTIMALDVGDVWMRPATGETHPSNLTQGSWQRMTVGRFADYLRHVFATPAPAVC